MLDVFLLMMDNMIVIKPIQNKLMNFTILDVSKVPQEGEETQNVININVLLQQLILYLILLLLMYIQMEMQFLWYVKKKAKNTLMLKIYKVYLLVLTLIDSVNKVENIVIIGVVQKDIVLMVFANVLMVLEVLIVLKQIQIVHHH